MSASPQDNWIPLIALAPVGILFTNLITLLALNKKVFSPTFDQTKIKKRETVSPDKDPPGANVLTKI